MNLHLGSAKSCAWYLKGKLREIGQDPAQEPGIMQSHLNRLSPDNLEEDYDPKSDFYNDFDLSGIGPELDYHFLSDQAETLTLAEEENEESSRHGSSAAATLLAAAAGVPFRGHQVLDDNNDERVVEVHPTAGQVISKTRRPSSDKDHDGDTAMLSDSETNQPDIRFHPFTSELDWRIAYWAIKDGPGHNAFDRLLAIPGVCLMFLVFYEFF
jgi:hypothetical protein